MRHAVRMVGLVVLGVACAAVAAAQSVTIPPLSPNESSTPTNDDSTD